MANIIISGCNGRMGRVVTAMCQTVPEITVVAGIDANPVKLAGYPVYADAMEVPMAADCIIDFSNPAALTGLLRYCKAHGCAAVLATTGYSEAQISEIKAASSEIAVFRSANMSLGINVLMELVKKAASVLKGYDIEIVEQHHNQKLDAPSGTALMIADAAKAGLDYQPEYVFERHSVRKARAPQEIGISSIRAGTIVGVHEAIFAGTDEIIEIKHTAMSREIFAGGAVQAALFLCRQRRPGMYNMTDLVQEGIAK